MIPSLVPSMIDVSCAPKQTGQARAFELLPITMTAAISRTRMTTRRIDFVFFIAASLSCAETTSRTRPGRATPQKTLFPRRAFRSRRPDRIRTGTRDRTAPERRGQEDQQGVKPPEVHYANQ